MPETVDATLPRFAPRIASETTSRTLCPTPPPVSSVIVPQAIYSALHRTPCEVSWTLKPEAG
jgi:hypothetical protein